MIAFAQETTTEPAPTDVSATGTEASTTEAQPLELNWDWNQLEALM